MNECSHPNCPLPVKAKGYCTGHLRRISQGQDMDPPIKTFKRASTQERFWAKVDKNGPIHPRLGTPCWIWTGATESTGGYGHIWSAEHGRARRAHVLSWEMAHGEPVPAKMVVRHNCDMPKCVNPDHLILGTHAENRRDAAERTDPRKGVDNPLSKLTEEGVLAIRREYASGALQKDLAAKHGVGQQTISQIVTGKTWTHL